MAANAGSTVTLHTPYSYSAPELVQARLRGETQGVVDPATDVWALGIICYELLTQTRAFPRAPPHLDPTQVRFTPAFVFRNY